MSLIKPSFSTGYAKNASESANPNLWKGLVGAWMPSFGVTGNTLKDVSGNGNDAQIVRSNAPSWKTGSLRNGVITSNYNSTGDYAVVTQAEKLELTSMTASCYVLVNGWVGNGDESAIFEKSISQVVNRSYLLFFDDQKLNARFVALGNLNHGLATDASTFPLGSWVPVACSYNEKTGETFLYRDGNIVASDLSTPAAITTGTGEFRISQLFSVPSRFRLNGQISDLTIHNRALSSAEIKQLYLNPAAPFLRKQQTVGISTAQAVPSANFNPFSVLTHPLEQ